MIQPSPGVGERAHSLASPCLGYKMALEPKSAAPLGYGCQSHLLRKQSLLPVSWLPVTPGGGTFCLDEAFGRTWSNAGLLCNGR